MEEAPRKPVDSRRRKRRSDMLIVGGVLAVLAGALVYAARDALTESVEPVAKPQAAFEPVPVQTAKTESDFIDDDGQSLWASPTHGPPLDLAYLPPGVEIILALRPEALASDPEGDNVFDAVEPIARNGFQFLSDRLSSVAGIKQIVIGWGIKSDGAWQTAFVARLSGHTTASEYLSSKFPNAVEKSHRGKTYWLVGERAYYAPGGADEMVLVVVPVDMIADILQLAGNPPPLRRDVERLLPHTDANRHVTVVVLLDSLFRPGETMFGGKTAPLRPALEWFLGDDIGAAFLSMNWDENFFIELVAVPTLDSSPERMSDELAARVNEFPDLVESVVLGLNASPYGRRVVARLPEMVRKLAAYTRHGFDRDCAVLRCYLPAVAGHNLLMGAELALAEAQWKDGERAGVSPVAEATSPGTIAERLQKKTSLRFAREELEAALDMLARDIGVEIVIRGQDLQLDGITRNQLFAIDLADAPAAEILVEILRRANPDKLAAGPADPRQKLVYVVGPEAIFITTRAKVADRGERLPDVFLPTP